MQLKSVISIATAEYVTTYCQRADISLKDVENARKTWESLWHLQDQDAVLNVLRGFLQATDCRIMNSHGALVADAILADIYLCSIIDPLEKLMAKAKDEILTQADKVDLLRQALDAFHKQMHPEATNKGWFNMFGFMNNNNLTTPPNPAPAPSAPTKEFGGP